MTATAQKQATFRLGRASVVIKDLIVKVKAKGLIAEAKPKHFKAKATESSLEDPRGQGLVLEDTSLGRAPHHL